MRLLKVLLPNMKTPFQAMEMEQGKPYKCKGFDASNADCAPGFYATEIEGLPYSYRHLRGDRVFECEVGGRSVEIDIYKRRYETLELGSELTCQQVRELALAHEPVCGYKLEQVLFPLNPFLLPKVEEVKDEHLRLLENWDSVYNSAWDSVLDSVRASAWASVLDSVRASAWASVLYSANAYLGSLFTNTKKWKYVTHEPGIYPFQAAVDLWKAGLVPSFDGKLWRLHSGNGAEVVWVGKL